jgi:integrase
MQTKPKQRKKAKIGSVQVKVSNNRLQLVFSFEEKRHYLSMGLPDTPYNRKQVQEKGFEIERDIQYGQFNPNNLAKYKIGADSTTVAAAPKILTALDIWQRYSESKVGQLKPKTIEKYENFARLFAKLGDVPVTDALAVKASLQQVTPKVDRVRDALSQLNSATTWAYKHNLIATMPFVGMAKEMPKPQYVVDPQPDAFSAEEMDRVIAGFQTDTRRGMTYRWAAPFVEFLFRIGCRPSEAIGLTWEHVSADCGTVHFTEALVQVRNRRVLSDKSKTNRTRSLSVSLATQALLLKIRPENPDPKALVFPSPDKRSRSINYQNFSKRGWKAITTPIKPETTPYSCRDTFITLQLLKGVPTGVIAKWCDTSVQMIERHYLDKLKINQLRPLD